MIKKITALLLVAFTFLPASSLTREQEKIAQRATLHSARSAADSLRILYDVYDLSPRKEQPAVAREIYDVALRANDYSACMDMLRHMAVLYKTDSVNKLLTEANRRLPDSQERSETDLFLQMMNISHQARYHSQAQLHKEVARLIDEEEKMPATDPRRRVMRLFSLVEYLSNGLSGNMIVQYVDKLEEATRKADFKLYAVRNAVLTETANLYSTVEEHDKAVEANRELLGVIDGLEKKYKNSGRRFRDYDIQKYVVYRRMLHNWKALSPEEIESYYARIKEIAARNPDVAADMERNPKAQAHYAMYRKDYPHAKEALQKVIANEKSIRTRRRLLEDLRLAASATGDNQLLTKALAEYNDIIRECDSLDSSEQFNELQVRFNVNELQAENTRLELENKNEQIAGTRRIMTFVMVGWVICALLLFALLLFWTRYRRMSVILTDFASRLGKERESLKNIRYQDNRAALHGRHEETGAAVANPFSMRQPDKSMPRMVEYILDDILYISSISKDERDKYITRTCIANLFRDMRREFTPSLTEGQVLDIRMPADDVEVLIDRECLEYVASHILRNALRTQGEGTVTVSCETARSGRSINIIFTADRTEVPRGTEEVVFCEFIDFEALSERDDSGLFLCRLIAMLMDCSIVFDPTCTSGSRCVFTIPRC